MDYHLRPRLRSRDCHGLGDMNFILSPGTGAVKVVGLPSRAASRQNGRHSMKVLARQRLARDFRLRRAELGGRRILLING